MSKARIRLITKKDTEMISKIQDWNEKDSFFTLVDKDGKIATNNAGHGIIYKSKLPDADMATIEAYGYLQYWAEEEVKFKNYTALELMTCNFTSPEIVLEDDIHFEQESYEKEFDEASDAKPVRKMRKAMVELQKAIVKMDKRIDGFSEYLEEIDDYRSNPEEYEEDPEEDEEYDDADEDEDYEDEEDEEYEF